ncbi:hypothetical protein C7121_07705 [Paenibacillus glucanolyticus]|uniref:Uncharacterized protein n=1 Tax=Paenibacillus glucanolyticus TaxID=59843 RepID=A0A163IHL1_9BACL|nr:hypothetical protein A3958_08125 [Paenibacillus glucanolyticus]AVV56033.1 hypothetical protein C7121_07705 [Paenibacillus glucanolyticus]KZS45971.1 hypothetical protein AWU65_08600 [Paenibacillus glucanolyticus]
MLNFRGIMPKVSDQVRMHMSIRMYLTEAARGGIRGHLSDISLPKKPEPSMAPVGLYKLDIDSD